MKHLLTLAAFLCTLSAFSQREIRGCVLIEKSREPVTGANVILQSANELAILASGVTDATGNFVLRSASMPDSVTLSVRSMTIGSHSKTVKSDIEFVEFLVVEKSIELREVIVQVPKIRQTGDTLHYNVASFLNETDRSIGDVLKKLPGIQVLSSGEIRYQDRPINRFYVEGLDLLKGRYNIATNNIDARQVITVQVLENHQPIKALKDTEIPETAAINLRLQNSALGAFFAYAQAGMGLPPVLLSNELVGMRFTSTQQNLVTYKGDNTGRDIAQELVSFYGASHDAYVRFLNVVLHSTPAINSQHFLFNDAHLSSLNDLRTLKKDLTLTSNINYLYDRHNRDSYARRDIFITGNEHILIEEDMRSRLLKRELESAITLESNTDERFLNNKLNISTRWNEESGEIRTNESISQRLTLPSFRIANEFEHLRKKGEKRIRSGVSAAYTRQSNSLQVMPVLFENLENIESPLQQNVDYNHLRANAYTDRHLSIERLNFGLGYRIGTTFNHHSMQSNFSSGIDKQPLVADSLRNDVQRNQASIDFMIGINRNFFNKRFNTFLHLPIQYVFLERNDFVRTVKHSDNYLIYSPALLINGSFNSRLSLLSNIQFANSVGGFMEDYQGYMMTSYRAMSRNEDLQNKSRTGNGFVSLSYRNPFTMLFATISLQYMHIWRNTLPDVRYNGILNITTSIRYPNTSNNYSLGFSLGKNVSASEVRITAGYSESNSIALNQGVISPYTSRAYRVSPSINSTIIRSLILYYNAGYVQNHVSVNNIRLREPIHNFTQNINTSIISLKSLIFNIGFNHYYNNAIQSSARSSWFANAGVRYKIKQMDVMLDWTNILNTRRFVTYSHSDVSSYYSEYVLRPSEVLLKVRFKIL